MATQGSPYRLDRRRRRRKGSSRLPSGSRRLGTTSIATVRSCFPSSFPNTAPDDLSRRLLTTIQSAALELQSTAAELGRDCHRGIVAYNVVEIQFEGCNVACNARRICLKSVAVIRVADSAALDCKRTEGCRRRGSAQDEPSLVAGGKQPWCWRPFKSSRNCSMSCPPRKCDEAYDTDVTPRRLKISIVSTARRCGDVGINMRAVGSIYLLGFEPLCGFV